MQNNQQFGNQPSRKATKAVSLPLVTKKNIGMKENKFSGFQNTSIKRASMPASNDVSLKKSILRPIATNNTTGMKKDSSNDTQNKVYRLQAASLSGNRIKSNIVPERRLAIGGGNTSSLGSASNKGPSGLNQNGLTKKSKIPIRIAATRSKLSLQNGVAELKMAMKPIPANENAEKPVMKNVNGANVVTVQPKPKKFKKDVCNLQKQMLKKGLFVKQLLEKKDPEYTEDNSEIQRVLANTRAELDNSNKLIRIVLSEWMKCRKNYEAEREDKNKLMNTWKAEIESLTKREAELSDQIQHMENKYKFKVQIQKGKMLRIRSTVQKIFRCHSEMLMPTSSSSCTPRAFRSM